MTADPSADNTEAITLALHEAATPRLLDTMADDVVLELGWGRLSFGQTFAEPSVLAGVLAHEERGRRDICIYARESHVLIARAPQELFIDPSHTYRLRFNEPHPTPRPPAGFSIRTLTRPADGRMRPESSAISVDLPDPDGPTSASISPGAIDRSTPASATTSPASAR